MEAFRDPELSPEERAEDLLRRMTLREKIGQLNQRLYGFAIYRREGEQIRFTREFQEEVARYGGLGCLYGLHRADPWSKRDFAAGLEGVLAVKARNRVQEYVISHSRFGIPALFSTECPHGHQALDGYLLPVNLAAGCTFAPELLEAAAEVAGAQLHDMGIDLALNSGVDMGLWDTGFQKLEEAVRRGLTDEAAIDRAARRILTLKFRRGLFENPYILETDAYMRHTHHACPQAAVLAEHSLVLLKNEKNLLPLPIAGRIGLTGPNADAIYNQLGDYTPPQRPGSGITIRGGLEAMGVPFVYAPGCPLFGGGGEAVKSALQDFAECDIVIAAVGGSSSRFAGGTFLNNGALDAQSMQTMDCGENVDAANLTLPGEQLRLLEAIHRSGKRLVTVLIGGRPYAMKEITALSDAVVCAFYPGPTGGEAIAKLLFGTIFPAGRLCVSLPDTPGQLPVYYNSKDSYRRGAYCDVGIPQFSFGFGVSGTAFSYVLLQIPAAEDLRLTFRIANTGACPGWAVPQLYLHRTQGIATSRIRQLCGFCKLYLAPGETRELTIPIPAESLIQWDAADRPVTPPGAIEWFLADEGENRLQGIFVLN